MQHRHIVNSFCAIYVCHKLIDHTNHEKIINNNVSWVAFSLEPPHVLLGLLCLSGSGYTPSKNRHLFNIMSYLFYSRNLANVG